MGDALPAAVAVSLVVVALCLATGPVPHALCRLLANAVRRYREMREANARAEALLRDVLAPDEYRGLLARGYLDVASPGHPGRTYRVPRWRGIVVVYEAGRPARGLCVGPVGLVPDADVVAMHKLMIEGAEDEYLERANRVSLAAFTRCGIDVLGEW